VTALAVIERTVVVTLSMVIPNERAVVVSLSMVIPNERAVVVTLRRKK